MEFPVRILLALAALSGLMGVAGGAFGAHAAASEQAKAWMQTGGHYQLTHAVAIFAAFGLWRIAARFVPARGPFLIFAGNSAQCSGVGGIGHTIGLNARTPRQFPQLRYAEHAPQTF